jgi:hypothetical protein
VLELTPHAINDTLGVLLKYQDDIARLHGSEAARLLEQVKSEVAAAALESPSPQPSPRLRGEGGTRVAGG